MAACDPTHELCPSSPRRKRTVPPPLSSAPVASLFAAKLRECKQSCRKHAHMPAPAGSTSCEVLGFGVMQLCVVHLRLPAEHSTPQFGHVRDILRKILRVEHAIVEPWCTKREQACSSVNVFRLAARRALARSFLALQCQRVEREGRNATSNTKVARKNQQLKRDLSNAGVSNSKRKVTCA